MELLSDVSFWKLFLTFIVILIIYFTVKFIIRPYLLTRHYEKQGMLTGRFIPILGYALYTIVGPGNARGDAYYYLKQLRKKNPEARLMVFPYMDGAQIFLGDTSLYQEFTVNQTKYYTKEPGFAGPFMDMIGQGLIFSEFEKWKRQRKLVSQAFHFEFIQKNLSVVTDTTKDIISQFPFKGNGPITIRAIDEFQKITGDVVCKIFFGQQVSNKLLFGKPLSQVLADVNIGIINYSMSLPNLVFGPKFQKMGLRKKDRELMKKVKLFVATLKEMIEGEKEAIANGMGKSREKSLARLLLEETDENGSKLSGEEVLHQFTTFFLAGMDTTGHLAGITTYYLCKYPQHKEAIEKEMDQFIKSEEDLTIENLSKLELMGNFIKEALRCNSPAVGMIPRVAAVDHMLGPYKIRKGTYINTNFYFLSWADERNFKDANEFKPERWAGAEAPDKKLGNPFIFTPFSAGARNCIGQHLAVIEAKIIMWTMIKKFKMSLPPNFELRMMQRFLLEPEDDIPLIIEPRNA
mgnify:CR=1 FL=1